MITPPSGPCLAETGRSTPRLIVTVDVEEEFDWSRFAADQMRVRNVAEQHRADAIYRGYGCVPTYLVDYPVASQVDGYQPLRDLLQAGRCLIGAQLHPWVNPPIDEQVVSDETHTFPGNLPREMEKAKLANLTRTISENFGITPRIYRAGRYGLGANTPQILSELGYQVDMSVLPRVDFAPIGGPSYRDYDHKPYWLNRVGGVVEIPLTSGFTGRLSALGDRIYPRINTRLGIAGKIPAIMTRLGLLNRVRLSPEGQGLQEAKDLTWAVIRGGGTLLTLAYHSSSLIAGGNPFVPTTADVDRILDWLGAYLDFFVHRVGGELTTPMAIYEEAIQILADRGEIGRNHR